MDGLNECDCDMHKKVDVELLYNPVRTGSQLVWRPDQLEKDTVEKASTQQSGPSGPRLSSCSWGSDELEIRCWIEEHVPERLGPQAPCWAAQENEKETQLWPIEWGTICCSSVRSPTPSHTRPFQIKWEVYFSKELYHTSLLWCYESACI